jgi:hypothetical protein
MDYLFDVYLFLGEHDSLNRIVVVFVDHLKLGVVFASLQKTIFIDLCFFKICLLACTITK